MCTQNERNTHGKRQEFGQDHGHTAQPACNRDGQDFRRPPEERLRRFTGSTGGSRDGTVTMGREELIRQNLEWKKAEEERKQRSMEASSPVVESILAQAGLAQANEPETKANPFSKLSNEELLALSDRAIREELRRQDEGTMPKPKPIQLPDEDEDEGWPDGYL